MAMVASCATNSPASRFAGPGGRLAKARSNVYLGNCLSEDSSLIMCFDMICSMKVIKSCGSIGIFINHSCFDLLGFETQ